MIRPRLVASISLLTIAAADPALAGQAYTTRIEPRPFYGATVTLEEGVRVYRALPVTRQVIINPGNKASVSVNYNEERHYNYSRSDNYDHSGGNSGGYGGGNNGGLFGSSGGTGTPIAGPFRDRGGDFGSRPGGKFQGRAGGKH